MGCRLAGALTSRSGSADTETALKPDSKSRTKGIRRRVNALGGNVIGCKSDGGLTSRTIPSDGRKQLQLFYLNTAPPIKGSVNTPGMEKTSTLPRPTRQFPYTKPISPIFSGLPRSLDSVPTRSPACGRFPNLSQTFGAKHFSHERWCSTAALDHTRRGPNALSPTVWEIARFEVRTPATS